jgi:hypothetical protein
LIPSGIFLEMPPEDVHSAGGRLVRNVQQGHMNLTQFTPTLAMITARAGCHHIRPDVFPAQMPRQDVIQGQIPGVAAAILAGIMVTAEDFTP